MKAPLFEYPSYKYEVDDWEFKKKGLFNRINKQKFIRTKLQTFETDRKTNKKTYLHYFQDLIRPELNKFCEEAEVSCSMTDCWSVRYQQGDYQSTHNHGGWGFSGILYVEFNPQVHEGTVFIAPWQNPRTDTTSFASLEDIREGSLFIFPAYCLHYAPPNKVKDPRIIVSFDLLPNMPEHKLSSL